MVGILRTAGYPHTVSLDEADTVVVNTCAFIRPAVEESETIIRDMLTRKAAGRVRRVVVTGCLPQRFPDSLPIRFPGVDAFLGVGSSPDIARVLDGDQKGSIAPSPPRRLPDHRIPRVLSTPPFRAYLRIAEGCSNHCTYCLIPFLRGELRSRSVRSVVTEAGQLAGRGVKEISLISQDTTVYGRDRKDGACLETLLRSLAWIDGISWIRILYAHPRGVGKPLARLMGRGGKIVPYLDLPIQHVSDRILKQMKRRVRSGVIRRRIEMLREQVPGLALRTTVMVGFPGESDREFRELTDFVSQVEFDHLGVFPFFPEPGTSAAGFPSQVPDRVKQERLQEIAALQARISRRKNASRVGRVHDALVEGYDDAGRFTVVRTPGQAPEIDGYTRVHRAGLIPGEFCRVKVTGFLDYDLVAELV